MTMSINIYQQSRFLIILSIASIAYMLETFSDCLETSSYKRTTTNCYRTELLALLHHTVCFEHLLFYSVALFSSLSNMVHYGLDECKASLSTLFILKSMTFLLKTEDHVDTVIIYMKKRSSSIG